MSRFINLLRNMNYLTKHSLWDQREEDIVYLTDKILDDCVYEHDIQTAKYKKPIILNRFDSLKYLISSGKSFVRLADGEAKILMGMDQPFQKFEPEIAKRLAELLSLRRDDILVCIPRPYYYNDDYDTTSNRFHRRYGYEYRKALNQYVDEDKLYLDTGITNPIKGQNGRNPLFDEFFEKWRMLFEGKDVAIVCGEEVLNRLQYDIFELTNSKIIIEGPRINGWDEHDRIIKSVVDKIPKSTVIIMILGMAGKAMIPELVDLGYICYDIGHMAKLYNSYMSNDTWNEEFTTNFFAPD